MKNVYRLITILALVALAFTSMACDDDVKDKINENLTVEKTIVIDDLEAVGFTEDTRDIVFEEDIPDYDDIKDNIDKMEIIDVEYRVYGNDGGSGQGIAFASYYQDPSSTEVLGEAFVEGGVDMADHEPLPLVGGALDFVNELIDQERFTVYFAGDASDIHFFAELVIKVKIQLKP